MQRDARIDIVRGAGVLMIALDHFAGALDRMVPGGFAVPFVTWSRIGWSSAAEFFVFFSGYLIGLVYVRTLDARGPMLLQARALHRSWQIYVANILTALIVLLLLYASPLGSREFALSAYFDRLIAADGSGWVGFLTLHEAPMFFEILVLYILLILLAPLVLLLARINILIALTASLVVWLAVQINPSINLWKWNFNPFAWQLMFVLGMLFSVGRVFEKLEASPRRQLLLIVSGAFVCVAGIVKLIDKSGMIVPVFGAIDIGGIDKTTLGPLRALHFLLSVVFIMQVLPRSGRLIASLPSRSVARIGQYSLECFCMSTILVYAGTGLLLNTSSVTTANVLLGGCVLIVLLCAFAVFMDWIRSEPWRGGGARKLAHDRKPADTIDGVTDGLRSLAAPRSLSLKSG